MAGVKGRSGTNKGKDKPLTDALRIAAFAQEAGSDKRKLRLIAEKIVDKAVEGEQWACQMVGDRLEGKPAQESTVTIDDKRDASDWTRDELVAVLDELRTGRLGTPEASGRGREPDSVH